MIYLDHHAATPVCREAEAAMERARAEAWANPHSVHAAGRASRAWLERARAQVAEAIGARPADVVLTSGGTESVNLGVFGLVGPDIRRVITTAIEHPAVKRSVDALEARGLEVLRLPALGGSVPHPSEADVHLGTDTLVALQWVNHETGTRIPVEAWAAAAGRAGARMLVDATQALGKLPVDVRELGVSALAVASHKVGGPAGAGALWVRRDVALEPPIHGGDQERGRRPGTPDVLHQVGFGAACAALGERLAQQPRVQALRDRLEARLVSHGFVVNGISAPRVGSVVDASHRGWRGEVLVAALDVEGVCASSGAACSSGVSAPSETLRAMYPAELWRATGALRLSLGPETTEDDVRAAEEALARVLDRGPRA